MALSLQKLGALGAKIGMGLAGDAKITVTLRLGTTTTGYDPATDAATVASNALVVLALPYNRKNRKSPNNEVTDKTFDAHERTLLIEAANLPAGTKITPNDTAEFDGAKWQVREAQLDPAKAAWIVDVGR